MRLSKVTYDQKYSKIVKYYNSYKVAVFKVLYFLEIWISWKILQHQYVCYNLNFVVYQSVFYYISLRCYYRFLFKKKNVMLNFTLIFSKKNCNVAVFNHI